MARLLLAAWLPALLVLACSSAAPAVNVLIDYSYDTSNFFGAGNPDGAAAGESARLALEAAADFYSGILDDTFLEIATPAPLTSSLPPHQDPGTAEWEWTLTFRHPSSSQPNEFVSLIDETIATDEYRIYAGALSLPGDVAGRANRGTWGWQSFNDGGFFTQEEIDEINATTDAFSEAVESRGEASGFATWGGFASFDTDGENNWHFDHDSLPLTGQLDFYSVALHEIAHALGLGDSSEWLSQVFGTGSNAEFRGPAASSLYGGYVPIAFVVDEMMNETTDRGHWREDTMSQVLGSAVDQEAAMDPNIGPGQRKLLTALDAAGLVDIGWTILAPPDLNGDGFVNIGDYPFLRDGLGVAYTQAEYELWRAFYSPVVLNGSAAAGSAGASAVVPEPAAWALALLGFVMMASRRRTPHNSGRLT